MIRQIVKYGAKRKSNIKLPEFIFGQKVSDKLLAQAVRVYLANKRQGTVKVKSRGEVSGSRRKIWRQKGTGRARHGDRYAPIFVGGGVAHGPKPRDYSLKLSKKMRRKALIGALSLRAREKNLMIVDGLKKIKPKTKEFSEFFKKEVGIEPKDKSTLLVVGELTDNIARGTRNIKNLEVIQANFLNAFEILRPKYLLITKDAIEKIEKQWK